MHLLVLSAFRQDKFDGACRFGGCAVSMHLLVLSAFRLISVPQGGPLDKSQCTFWCSVLSDKKCEHERALTSCLNAPSGAQCFPT